MNLLPGIDLAIKAWRESPPRTEEPLVLPDWLNSSEVSYAVSRLGAVRYRGQTIEPSADIRGVK